MNFTKKYITNSRRIILGFLAIIFVGALLLTLPFSTRVGEHTTFLGALFTAVSSTCVTGLVVYDTATHWTVFGQLIILLMIQIGGLGFITISTFIMISLKRKIGLSRRVLVQDSLSTLQIKGSIKLVRRIILGTAIFEGIGAVLLSSRFVKDMGWLKGIYYGVFHSISAFCNAGFDLMGYKEKYSSFCSYFNDPVVIITLSLLIIIGGIGFVVWEDLYINKLNFKKYNFQTKAVLSVTFILLFGGTLLFLITENSGLFKDMTVGEKLLSAFFSAVTPRTAGFNSVDTTSLSNGGFFATIILMFIGGSPGSTAGGIKTTTVFVIVLYIKAYLLREKDCVAFKSRMDNEVVKKASIVIFINLILAIVGSLIIMSVQGNLAMRDVLFEVFSAGGTVGMSTGVTRDLNTVSRIVIMILMFFGRMGSLTFAMSFTEHRKVDNIRYPQEQLIVG